ncbi:MAG: MFS transporter [Dehalococcoidia bacterium]
MNSLTVEEQRAYEANIWKSYAFQFLQSFQLWWPIWVLYLTDMRGFSLTQVSGLEALFWLVIVLAEVPTGAVADRFGRRTSLMLSAASTTTAILVFGLATNYWIVLVSYVAWGFGLTFQSGADSALVFESLKAVGRERDYQRVAGVGWGIFSLGTLAGMLAGAPIAAATDLAFPILLSSAIAFMALLMAATMKEPELAHDEVRLGYRTLIAESARTAWRLPAVRTMLVLSAVLMASTNASFIFAQPFLHAHDVSTQMLGVAQSPVRLGGILGAVLAYRAVGAFGMRTALVAAMAVIGVSYAVIGAWDSVFAFAALAPITLMSYMMLPIVSDYLNVRIPSSQRATILSIRQLLFGIVIACFQPGLGLIADHVSLEAVFFTSAGFVVATAPIAYLFWLRADRAEADGIERAAEVGATPAGG